VEVVRYGNYETNPKPVALGGIYGEKIKINPNILIFNRKSKVV
jgi:hypothetical protein